MDTPEDTNISQKDLHQIVCLQVQWFGHTSVRWLTEHTVVLLALKLNILYHILQNIKSILSNFAQF